MLNVEIRAYGRIPNSESGGRVEIQFEGTCWNSGWIGLSRSSRLRCVFYAAYRFASGQESNSQEALEHPHR